MPRNTLIILVVISSVLINTAANAVWYPKPFHDRRLRASQKVLQVDPTFYTKPFPRTRLNEEPTTLKLSPPANSATVPQTASSKLVLSGGQQTIIDHGDTFLTISLEIGSQQIHAIPDSGSFELYIVDGDDCDLQLCRPAYKPDSSSNHFTPQKPLKKDIYFGSGTCGVELSFDSVRVHNEHGGQHPDPTSNSLVPLWRIVEMDENLAAVWGDGHGFQGIVGLGFKGNSHKDSRDILLEEQVMVEARDKAGPQGVDLTKPGFASKALFGDVFAICLPRGEDAKPVDVFAQGARQDDGRLWWGKDFVPNLNWVNSPVIGTRHWTIAIESSFLQQDAKKSDSEIIHTICGGPGNDAKCAALVDSGTSLIAMSEVKIRKLLATTIIGSLNPDCSNVDEMPDLVFNLGRGQNIVLTPDTYVMKIRATDIPRESSGRVVLEKGKVLNIQPPPKNLISLKAKRGSDSITYCTHAFMETPMETALVQGTEHELIILGIPVFREYSVKFDRNNEVLAFAQHPFGTTCHDLVRSDGKPITSFAQEGKRHNVRSLGNLRNLVFPDEFTSL